MEVGKINPEDRDYLRALELEGTDGKPDDGKARRMAKAIKDPYKLVRRAKAVVGIWGEDDVWVHFNLALIGMGFDIMQILEISNFEIDEDDL